jgi:uncharacterized protein (DUF1778 family)
MPRTNPRTEKLDIRITPGAKHILQIAAVTAHQSVSDFVIKSALSRAEEILPDRQHFGLDAMQWEAFQAALDAPPRPTPRLGKLLQEPSVFERGTIE